MSRTIPTTANAAVNIRYLKILSGTALARRGGGTGHRLVACAHPSSPGLVGAPVLSWNSRCVCMLRLAQHAMEPGAPGEPQSGLTPRAPGHSPERLFDLLDLRPLLLHHLCRQWRVIQLCGDGLALVEHPGEKADHGLLLALILPLGWYQQIGEARNGIRVFARGVGNGH